MTAWVLSSNGTSVRAGSESILPVAFVTCRVVAVLHHVEAEDPRFLSRRGRVEARGDEERLNLLGDHGLQRQRTVGDRRYLGGHFASPRHPSGR
mgnify:CR=1 FL=1